MALVAFATGSQTVTVATETALATIPAGQIDPEFTNPVLLSGVVQCAAGTGGTAATVRVRQGVGVAGTQVGSSVVSPAATAGVAAVVPFSVVDSAPGLATQYTVTVAYAGNTSSVVTSTLTAMVEAQALAE